MNQLIPLLLVALPLIGLADAGFITYESLTGTIPACGAGFDCGTVLTSKWASIGPVPVSLLGVLFYATALVLASLNLLEVPLFPSKVRLTVLKNLTPLNSWQLLSPLQVLVVLSWGAVLFSGFLVFLMAVVIKSWCLFCLVSAAVSLGIFLLTHLELRTSKKNQTALRLWFGSVIGYKYHYLLKPLFFLFDAEFIHNTLVSVGEWLGKSRLGRATIGLLFDYRAPALSKTLDDITFPSPVGLAAGFDYNGQLTQILPSLGFGFHTIGTVTLKPYQGNSGKRLDRFKASKALLVNKGLKSWGAVAVIKKLRGLSFQIPTGISIGATNQHYTSTKAQILDILQSFALFEKSSLQHAYYELNISCPNTFGGEPFTTPARLELLLSSLDRLAITKPLYIKMPIDQEEKITLELLKVSSKHHVAGLIFGNLTKDKQNPLVHPDDRKRWLTQPGNVSGKPTWERSNNALKLTKKHFGNRFTLIGTGGIFSPQDLETKQALGADLCQLITGMIYQGPQLIGQINSYLHYKHSGQALD